MRRRRNPLIRCTGLFGDRLDEFDRAVRQTLKQLSDADTFPGDDEVLILIGRRTTAPPAGTRQSETPTSERTTEDQDSAPPATTRIMALDQ